MTKKEKFITSIQNKIQTIESLNLSDDFIFQEILYKKITKDEELMVCNIFMNRVKINHYIHGIEQPETSYITYNELTTTILAEIESQLIDFL